MAKQRKQLPIVGFFSADDIRKESSERTINWYVKDNKQGKFPQYLAPWPGHLEFLQFTQPGAGRNVLLVQDVVYFVVGDTIYRMGAGLIPSVLALNFFNTVTGYVGIAAVNDQVMFVDGEKAFIWDIATLTGTDITATLNGLNIIPLDVTAKDGYFLVISSDPATRLRFYASAVNDGTTWGVNDFASASPATSGLNAITTIGANIFLFGELATEIWYDAGTADFQFRKNVNVLIGHGTKAPASVATGIFERLGQPSIEVGFYLSNNDNGVGSIMMSQNGGRPVPVSSPEIDEVIQDFQTPEDAQGFIIKFGDQSFYIISFTGDERTFVYQIQLGQWVELESLTAKRYRASMHVYYKGKHFIGDYENNSLYELNKNYFTYNDEKIKRTRILRVINSPTLEYFRLDRIIVDCLQGTGLKNTKGAEHYPLPPFSDIPEDVNPRLFLDISEDGGVVYNSFGWRDIGQSGQIKKRTEWTSLGTRRDLIVKFYTYNAVPIYILGAEMDIEVGNN